MFAVIETGGKQYRVEPGKVLKLEKLEGDLKQEILFDKVLLTVKGDDIQIGTPYVGGALVKGVIVDQSKDNKIKIFKKKRRKGYKKQMGHRQLVTIVKFTDFTF